MLDCRYNKTPETDDNPELWGKAQLAWLKNALKASDEPIKFITNGIQVLNNLLGAETCAHYQAERQELLDFIRDEKIEGVIFLTGDRHFTQLEKQNLAGIYPLYDFTCSALTSPHLPSSSPDFGLRIYG